MVGKARRNMLPLWWYKKPASHHHVYRTSIFWGTSLVSVYCLIMIVASTTYNHVLASQNSLSFLRCIIVTHKAPFIVSIWVNKMPTHIGRTYFKYRRKPENNKLVSTRFHVNSVAEDGIVEFRALWCRTNTQPATCQRYQLLAASSKVKRKNTSQQPSNAHNVMFKNVEKSKTKKTKNRKLWLRADRPWRLRVCVTRLSHHY